MTRSVSSQDPVEQSGSSVLLRLRVQPRAGRDELAGLHGDAIRIRLQAPPVDGSANEALVRLLARQLQVPRSRIRLRTGHSSRSKVVIIEGADAAQVRRSLGI
jgi:uncharacterized protein